MCLAVANEPHYWQKQGQCHQKHLLVGTLHLCACYLWIGDSDSLTADAVPLNVVSSRRIAFMFSDIEPTCSCHCIFMRLVSDIKVARSIDLAGPRRRKQPMTKSSASMEPDSVRSKSPNKLLASEGSRSMERNTPTILGLSICALKSCQVMSPASDTPISSKMSRSLLTMSASACKREPSRADSTNMPVIMFSKLTVMKAMYADNTTAIAGDISSVSGSLKSRQSTPLVIAWKRDMVHLPMEPK
mmetsp:Transcript_45860/g.109200  ORF Transcript_45860/g.109200 Transcript_45860/m.109200 type:complete len:244 (-) Transcript_45860:1934-2665(-)